MTTATVPDFFRGVESTAAIKQLYRDLCRIHHPDVGGDTATMQALNAQYDAASRNGHRQERPDRSDQAYDYYANADIAVRQAIDAIITLPDITIEIAGWWVWIGGNTRAVKDQLKAAGYRWSPKKGMWYYPGCPSKGKGETSMDDIRAVYGSQTVTGRQRSAMTDDDD